MTLSVAFVGSWIQICALNFPILTRKHYRYLISIISILVAPYDRERL